jgi:hypothetical protein
MIMIVRKNMNCADAIRMGLEQVIAQQLLGVWLGAQLERCSWNNFLEVPNWEVNPKRSPSPQKAREKFGSSPLMRLLVSRARQCCWLLQATGQARRAFTGHVAFLVSLTDI